MSGDIDKFTYLVLVLKIVLQVQVPGIFRYIIKILRLIFCYKQIFPKKKVHKL